MLRLPKKGCKDRMGRTQRWLSQGCYVPSGNGIGTRKNQMIGQEGNILLAEKKYARDEHVVPVIF